MSKQQENSQREDYINNPVFRNEQQLLVRNKLKELEKTTTEDLEALRHTIRGKMLRGEEVGAPDKEDSLENLLKREYELELIAHEAFSRAEMIRAKKDPESPKFKHELDLKMTRKKMEYLTKEQLDDYRKTIQENVVCQKDIPTEDIAGQLLAKEFQNERALKRIAYEEECISSGMDKESPKLQTTVDLKMNQYDIGVLDPEKLKLYETQYKEKKSSGEEIDRNNTYFALLSNRDQLQSQLDALVKQEEEKKLQEKLQKEEQLRQIKLQKEEQRKKAIEDAKIEAEKNPFLRIQIQKEEIQKKLKELEKTTTRDLTNVRHTIRSRMLKGEEVGTPDNAESLENLLKKEYELELEGYELYSRGELLIEGKDMKSPKFKYELDLMVTKRIMEFLPKEQLDDYRKTIQEKVVCRKLIPTADIAGQLLLREFQNERALQRIAYEEECISSGMVKGSPMLQSAVNLKMMQFDIGILDPEKFKPYENEYKEKRSRGEEIDIRNAYFYLLYNQEQLQSQLDEFVKQEEEKKPQEKPQEKPLEKPQEEEKKSQEKPKEKSQEKPREEEKKSQEKPQQKPQKEEEKKRKDKLLQEERNKKAFQKKATSKDTTPKMKREQAAERKKNAQHRYKVEFAGKELKSEIRNCGDPKVLAMYLDNATKMKPEVREHLEARILANAKIESYEKSRTIKQKNRPPAVKYKDGTILLKNKKKDVAKQTTMNGCWSAVLSDMLNHFGVDLSQEEIRAYRPELNAGQSKSKEAKNLMERLNYDAMNEINDMADLIQRTVPNVAHHHMSFGASQKKNKAVFKETVSDALLNKNSPVAVLYGNHYLSIVGIKGNTLIVQNPSPYYDSKYQKLSIDDLFDGCKKGPARGQVTIDWLEDLKFQKDGTCKNVTEQWKNMGISCTKREFSSGKEAKYVSHVKGNEFYDTSRIGDGIEETIYLPKMSFGKEKDLEDKLIKSIQLQNVKDKSLTTEYALKHELKTVKDDTEIETNAKDMEDLEMRLREFL